MDSGGLGQILQWAQTAQQQNPSGFPIHGEGLGPQQASYWQGNQLQIPGLGGLLQVGVNGAGAGGGAPGGGSPGGGIPGGGINVGGGSGAGGLNNGTLNAAYYYQRYPAVLEAYNGLGPEDTAYLESQGYQPSYTGFAQYHYDTYGNYIPDWAIQGLSGPQTTNTSAPTPGPTTPPVTNPLNPVGQPVVIQNGARPGLGANQAAR